MIFLIGGTGYIGSQFAADLENRGIEYMNLSRAEYDYYSYDLLYKLLEEYKPDFVINCAGYTGKPNVDACELFQEETYRGNVVLPAIIGKACDMRGIPWGHVSSGCIYNGYEKDYTEEDEPNFCFEKPPCSHYSGTKTLGEQRVKEIGGKYYIWRLRIAFDENDNPRNYLTKLLNYDRLLDAKNSISHRADFAKYCNDLWINECDYGIYNVVNTNAVSTKQVTDRMNKYLKLNKEFQFFEDEEQMYRLAASTPRSNCVLDNTKLRKQLGKHNIKVRTTLKAIEHALKNWTGETGEEDSGIDQSFWK